jgi:hypothetical protein
MLPDGCDACASVSPPSREPWQKVLWREQPGYPDTHTDATFLQSLSVSVQPERDFWRVVRGSAAVTQQMSTAAIACAAANYLLEVRHTNVVRVTSVSLHCPSRSHAVACSRQRSIAWVLFLSHVSICRPWSGLHPTLILCSHCRTLCGSTLLDVESMFIRRMQERIAARKLLQYDAMLIAALGVGCLFGGARPPARLLLRGLRQCMLLMTGVYLLSPLLQACQKPYAALQERLDLLPSCNLSHMLRSREEYEEHCPRHESASMCIAAIAEAAVVFSRCSDMHRLPAADADAHHQHRYNRGHYGLPAAHSPIPARLQLREQRD